MQHETYYRRMFFSGAIFNFVMAAAMLLGENSLGAAMGMTTPFDPLGKQLFGAFVIVFGIGYWIVSRDITRNDGLVWIGIIGKLAATGLFFAHAIAGNISYRLAAPTLIDALYAVLFAEFLLNGRHHLRDKAVARDAA